MKIVIILICLALARFAHTEQVMRQWHWVDRYLQLIGKPLQQVNGKSPWLGLLLVLLPVLIVVSIVFKLIGGGAHHFGHFIISILILWYCLSVTPVKQDLAAYHNALTDEGQNSGAAVASLLGSDIPQDQAHIPRAVTKAIFWQPLQRLFGVLFWFVVLGPLGTLLYHLITVLREAAAPGNVDALSIYPELKISQAVLDWLPARVVGFGYALAGHFVPTFSYWWKNLLTGLDQSQTFLSDCGMIALNAKETDYTIADPAEHRAALALVARTLIMLLALILIFSLGNLAYR